MEGWKDGRMEGWKVLNHVSSFVSVFFCFFVSVSPECKPEAMDDSSVGD
jgi:hypothetical protein